VDAPNDIRLESMLRDNDIDPVNTDRNDTNDPIIWLIWLSDEDFLGFDGNHPIGLIYENEVDIKRKKFEKKGKRLELVPLRIYQLIANHNFRQYQTFHGLLEDEEEWSWIRDRKEMYDPIIWLVWLSENNFLGLDGGDHPIGLIHENKVDLKRRKVEGKVKKLELIPLQIYQSIACHNFQQYQTFHGQI